MRKTGEAKTGKFRLSRKVLLPRPEKMEVEERQPRPERTERPERGERGGERPYRHDNNGFRGKRRD